LLSDNLRALNLTKKMGFKLEYLSDGTVKGVLDLKEEMLRTKCPEPEKAKPPSETKKKEKSILEKPEKEA
jgi:hypothetical protein